MPGKISNLSGRGVSSQTKARINVTAPSVFYPSRHLVSLLRMAKETGTQEIPVIDLFAGPGGLGEGFSAAVTADGKPAFRLSLSIEQDKAAWETLRLRAFFRQFQGDAPDEYYSALRGECTLRDLYDSYPDEFNQATSESWCQTLEAGSRESVQRRIGGTLRASGNKGNPWVLIGGPPCQGYSVVGRARRVGLAAYRPADDERLFLYKEYLHVLATNRPAIFVMENVEGLLSAEVEGQAIFERILDELREPGKALGSSRSEGLRYELFPLAPRSETHDTPQNFVVNAAHYSIPQARHRVIIVGINSEIRRTLRPLTPARSLVTTREVLEGLPELRSGLSKEKDCDASWIKAVLEGRKEQWFKEACRNGRVATVLKRTVDSLVVPRGGRGKKFMPGKFPPDRLRDWFWDKRLQGVCNHESRGHMKEDLHRYLFAAAFAEAEGYAPKLPEFPKTLLPKHVNLQDPPEKWKFKDRFKVQVGHAPAATVTSHISKDGHYYIHYSADQVRSLTVREAARLQTFPDNYYFVRERTDSYHQVGNAVPPLLAKQIAERVREVLAG